MRKFFGKKSEEETKSVQTNTVFVGNVAMETTEKKVYEFFSQAGRVVRMRIGRDANGKSRGFCHVEFATIEEAANALKLNMFEMDGRKVRVNFSEPISDQKCQAAQVQEQVKTVTIADFEVVEKLILCNVFVLRKKDTGTLHALRIYDKEKVFHQNQLKQALAERNTLSRVHHPFIVRLDYTFQANHRLYLVMQFCPGGSLGVLLAKERRLSIKEATVYAAEIILAIECLHKLNIIHRNIGVESIVFDEDGHAMLTNFDLSKPLMDFDDVSHSFVAKTAFSMAPEMLKRSGHTRSIDWYMLGAVIYEMIVGVPAYFNTDKDKFLENIQKGPLKIPAQMPEPAKKLVLALLNRNPAQRLGSGPTDAEEIKSHEFFASVNWSDIASRKGLVPIPKLRPQITEPQKEEAAQLFVNGEQKSQTEFANAQMTQTDLAGGGARVFGWSFVHSDEEQKQE